MDINLYIIQAINKIEKYIIIPVCNYLDFISEYNYDNCFLANLENINLAIQ